TATSPGRSGRREPHSRQYSWPSACGAPQRGQRRSSSGMPTGYRSQRSPSGFGSSALPTAAASGSGSSFGDSAALPQPAQNSASAGRGLPQLSHATTGSPPTGRPELAQKGESQGT